MKSIVPLLLDGNVQYEWNFSIPPYLLLLLLAETYTKCCEKRDWKEDGSLSHRKLCRLKAEFFRP